MTTALAPVQTAPLSTDQIELVKRTVAQGATNDELALYFHDCQRRGVHPLDKLIHFTKRGGKYTPITSIDFMRGRAHDTGRCAGISDPEFTGEAQRSGFAARVIVKRMVDGHPCEFGATARWEEYCPPAGQDHMWKKMPHVMLGKCAEALALRKAFPQELSGLYAREEMDQAGAIDVTPVTSATVEEPRSELPPVSETVPADGKLRISHLSSQPTRKAGVTKFLITLTDGRIVTTIKQKLAGQVDKLFQAKAPVWVQTKETQWGVDLEDIGRDDDYVPDDGPAMAELTDDDIPF